MPLAVRLVGEAGTLVGGGVVVPLGTVAVAMLLQAELPKALTARTR